MGTADQDEADLIVVGFGGAGAACAIAAADHGAEVIVLEKQPEDRHTPSTFMSGGIVMGVDDVDRATSYMDRCAGGMIPIAVTRAWATMAADLVGWLDRIGADLALVKVGEGENTQFEGTESVQAWTQSRPCADGTDVRDLSAPLTVGAMARVHDELGSDSLGDPAKVAQVVLAVAGMAEPPLRLILGSEAYAYAMAAARARAESDAARHDLTVSTDRDDATAAQRDPLSAASS